MADIDFLSGGGEMGERIRAYDWTATSLGPPEQWPRSLKTCVRIMLTSRQPIWIGWGRDLIKLYNDPYKSIVGGKHPVALGQPASVVWKDIWADISPMLDRVMNRNEGTYAESQLLIMERYGYKEETYYTFSYSPVPGGDGQTGGMICYNTSETDKVLNERSLKTLSELSNTITDCQHIDEVFEEAAAAISDNRFDFPFGMFYSCRQGKTRLLSCWGVGKGTPLAPEVPGEQDVWNLSEVIASGQPAVVENFPDPPVAGPWPDPSRKAVIFPIYTEREKAPSHLLIAGLNPYRKFDDRFEAFVKLICEQIAQAVNIVEALESEKRRAQALEELDRSKTVFFSNISHEFRTPITLMLGPMEEFLRGSQDRLNPEERERIETTHRNAMRLLKLVNGLLDFSKVESGRVQARYVKTDIAAFTRSLASNFESLMGKAGLDFRLDVPVSAVSVFIDRQMWEKIVFNLLSNAFKYTLEGSVSLILTQGNGKVYLKVADTGVGIPEEELPRMFERFHRVEGTAGRTYEGTGIGLSMVRELVRMHGGTISVESGKGAGTTFTVEIPLGSEHLPKDRVAETALDFSETVSDAFIQEATVLIDQKNDTAEDRTLKKSLPVVLVVDDNADMRNYIVSLLKSRYNVVAAVNGRDALEKAVAHHPALVISDVMMPVMDGIEFTRALKKNPSLSVIPVILLTARAGEESRIEGLETGADDYLVKPFSARELVSRAAIHLQMAEVRRNAQKAAELERNRLYSVFMQAPAIIAILRGPDHVFELANQHYMKLVGAGRNIVGQRVTEALPEVVGQGFIQLLDEVYRTGKPHIGIETQLDLDKNEGGALERRYCNFVYQPYLDEEGKVTGIIAHAVDVTDQVLARKRVEESEALLRTLAESLQQMVWIRNANGQIEYASHDWENYSGINNVSLAWKTMLHPDDTKEIMDMWERHQQTGTPYEHEVRLKHKSGVYRWHRAIGTPVKDSEGKIIRWIGALTDIHTQKMFTEHLEKEVALRTGELRRSNEDLQQFAHVASHDLKEPVRKIKVFTNIIQNEYSDVLDDRGRLYVQKLQTSVDRVKRMIEGVLQYSIIDSSDSFFEKVDILQVIENVRNDLEIIISAKNAQFNVMPVPPVEGAPVLIHQLFYNLVNNSLKFSRSDVHPVIHISGARVHSDSRAFIEIKLSDNGIGFEDSKAEEIFKTFKRLHSKDDYEGTGLGLSLCKKIVERHGGTIMASGSVNEGAEFRILLPEEQPKKSGEEGMESKIWQDDGSLLAN